MNVGLRRPARSGPAVPAPIMQGVLPDLLHHWPGATVGAPLPESPMTTIARRSVLTAALVCGSGRARAAEPLEIVTYDIRPLAIPGEGRRGIVLDIVAEAARMIGREPRFTFLPFPETVERGRTIPGTLTGPLGRVPSREASFAWVARVLDVPQAMGTLADRPAADLAAARGLERIGVIRNGLQEVFLRENGFGNLVVMETGRDLALALAEGRLDAWYSSAPEIAVQFEGIGRAGAVRIGPPLQTVPAWLAAHPDTRDLPVAPLRDALARLDADGTVARIYRGYIPA